MSSSDGVVPGLVFCDPFELELQREIQYFAYVSASNSRDTLVAQLVLRRAYGEATEVAIEIPGHHLGQWACLHYSVSDPVIVTQGHHHWLDPVVMETSFLSERRDLLSRTDELNDSTSRVQRNSVPGK